MAEGSASGNGERTVPAKPLGILPKNTQAMVIAGIAAVMVGAIAFSGLCPKTTTKPTLLSSAGVNPDQSRIAEYRQRLDEQARKLAAEQAQFLQSKQQFGAAAAGASLRGSCRPPRRKQH